MAIGPTPVQTALLNSGSGTSALATFGSGVTLNNLLVARLAVFSNGFTFTTPTNWFAGPQIFGSVGTSVSIAIFYTVVNASNGFAGTTGFTFAYSVTHSHYLYIEEWNSTNGWPGNPLDQQQTLTNSSATTLLDTGATPTTTQGEELWCAEVSYRASLQSISGTTAGWTIGDHSANGTNGAGVSAYQITSAVGIAEMQTTLATTAELNSGLVATFKDNMTSPSSLGQVIGGPKAQWPNAPTRQTMRFDMNPSGFMHQTLKTRLPDTNDAVYPALEQFFGDGTNIPPMNPHAQWPNAPVRFTGRIPMGDQSPGFSLANPQNGVNTNDLTIANAEEFYGRVDVLPVLPVQVWGIVFAGTATIVPGVETTINPAPTFAGTSTLTPGVEVNIDPAPTFAGTSTFVPGVEVNINPAPTFAGQGTLIASPDLISQPVFAGTSSLTLTVSVGSGIAVVVTFAGTSTFTPGVEVNINPAPTFAGVGTLVPGVEVNIKIAPTFAGTSSLTPGVEVTVDPAPTFAGTSSLTATGLVNINPAPTFAGVGSLTPGVETNINIAPTFTGVGSLVVQPEVNIRPAPTFSGLGVLSLTVSSGITITATFAGVGTLVPGAEVNISIVPSFVGVGTLIVGPEVNIKLAPVFAGIATFIPGVAVTAALVPRTPVGSTSFGAMVSATVLGADQEATLMGSVVEATTVSFILNVDYGSGSYGMGTYGEGSAVANVQAATAMGTIVETTQ